MTMVTTQSTLYFAIAVVFLLMAHILRSIRWRVILLQDDIYTRTVTALAALSVGYLINAIFPFRLGEITRSAFMSYMARQRFSSIFATVIAERIVDLLVVSVIGLIVFFIYGDAMFVITTIVLFVASIAVLLFIHCTQLAKSIVYFIAAVFNDSLKSAILHFFYSVTHLIVDGRLIKSLRFWMLTLAMWACYIVSLLSLGHFLSISFFEAFLEVYSSALNLSWSPGFGETRGWILIYLLAPIVIVVICVALWEVDILARSRTLLRSLTAMEYFAVEERHSLRSSFWSEQQYVAFLNRRFAGTNDLLANFEDRGLDDVRLHRLFQGGSGAVTALVEVDGQLRVRKFATGEVGAKMTVQRDWLQDNCTKLPLVKILSSQKSGADFLYDMEYIAGSLDMYEGIHASSLVASKSLLGNVIAKMRVFHCSNEIASAGDADIEAYIRAKVLGNFSIIKEEFQDIISDGIIVLNGEPFDTLALSLFEDMNWFVSKLSDRRQSVIHGDLTIENIMLLPNSSGGRKPESWFLIDPNPVNGFQSPLIDYAKIMQSLHLGYEALHKRPKASYSEGQLTVGVHRSFQYDALFNEATDQLTADLGEEGMKQVFIHEWINYLRLIPYQLRHSREAGLAFFGCLCLLLRNFERRYPGELS